MRDPDLDALLDLVEESLAWAHALADDGGDAVPVDPEARPGGVAPPPVSRRDPPLMVAPRPTPPRPTPPSAVPPRVEPVRTVVPEPARTAPPSPAPAAAPALFSAPAPAAGLFGVPDKWATWREDPMDKLQKARAARPATCVECGRPDLRIVGTHGARLMVLAAPMAGEADEMFGKMLVKVLRQERGDVLMVEARRCGACAEVLRAEVRVFKPALVLAMGDVARALVGAAVGTWSSWEEAGALGTHHPDELLRRPDDKRAAFAHLQELERRL